MVLFVPLEAVPLLLPPLSPLLPAGGAPPLHAACTRHLCTCSEVGAGRHHPGLSVMYSSVSPAMQAAPSEGDAWHDWLAVL